MDAAETPDNALKRAQFSSANDALQHIFYAVAHDFGRPIRQIVAFTSLLNEKLNSDMDDEAREWFSYLESAGTEAQIMLERLLTYSRLANAMPTLTMLDVGELCESAIAELSRTKSAASLVKIEGSASIRTDSQLLQAALIELVDNAIAYGDPEGTTIEICPQSGGVKVSVVNVGAGINPDQVESALRPFGRVHEEHQEHVGMGLNICQSALTAIGGTLSFEQRDGTFAVHVKLP